VRPPAGILAAAELAPGVYPYTSLTIGEPPRPVKVFVPAHVAGEHDVAIIVLLGVFEERASSVESIKTVGIFGSRAREATCRHALAVFPRYFAVYATGTGVLMTVEIGAALQVKQS
jgi:hypothetical protein